MTADIICQELSQAQRQNQNQMLDEEGTTAFPHNA